MSEQHAGRAARFGATLIDYSLVSLLMLVIMLVTGLMEDAQAYVDSQPLLRLSGLLVLSYLLLNARSLRRNAQTLGKRWMDIRITTDDGLPGLAWWRLLLRAFGLLIIALALNASVDGLGLLLLLLDPLLVSTGSRRTLRDYLAGTRVSTHVSSLPPAGETNGHN
jgi:uncharacterized RDD family membrane protein YckC